MHARASTKSYEVAKHSLAVGLALAILTILGGLPLLAAVLLSSGWSLCGRLLGVAFRLILSCLPPLLLRLGLVLLICLVLLYLHVLGSFLRVVVGIGFLLLAVLLAVLLPLLLALLLLRCLGLVLLAGLSLSLLCLSLLGFPVLRVRSGGALRHPVRGGDGGRCCGSTKSILLSCLSVVIGRGLQLHLQRGNLVLDSLARLLKALLRVFRVLGWQVENGRLGLGPDEVHHEGVVAL
mmetsp:Transcript_16337/g.51186  ORF Transcript_16337/g.51186 Transcript_16337/m.51186 type:complete len:236 (-) Transcript_16337:527-1234(-)